QRVVAPALERHEEHDREPLSLGRRIERQAGERVGGGRPSHLEDAPPRDLPEILWRLAKDTRERRQRLLAAALTQRLDRGAANRGVGIGERDLTRAGDALAAGRSRKRAHGRGAD